MVNVRDIAPEVIEDVLRLYDQGMGQKAIGRALGVSYKWVLPIAHDAGRGPRPQHAPKFTPEVEQEITRRHQAGESTKALAAEFGCCTVTVQSVARRNGGTLGPRGNRFRDFSPDEIAQMRRRWEAGESQHAIAQSLGTGQTIVSRVLINAGATTAKRPASGERHGKWKGGRIEVNGYWSVRIPIDHPFASMARRGGYVMEHRLVMAESLGRPLLSSAYVHHVDGDRGNNRLDNLQLMAASHTKGQAMCCADCGSRNLVPCPIPEGG